MLVAAFSFLADSKKEPDRAGERRFTAGCSKAAMGLKLLRT